MYQAGKAADTAARLARSGIRWFRHVYRVVVFARLGRRDRDRDRLGVIVGGVGLYGGARQVERGDSILVMNRDVRVHVVRLW